MSFYHGQNYYGQGHNQAQSYDHKGQGHNDGRNSRSGGSSSSSHNYSSNYSTGFSQNLSSDKYVQNYNNAHLLPPPPPPQVPKRLRRTRWNEPTEERVVIPGMPTIIPDDLTTEQQRLYVMQLQIEELTRRLRVGDLGIPSNPEERSPSPEPVYNNDGKRLNTREARARKKLEEERHYLIQKMLADNPGYKPPIDYKPIQTKMSEKVVIPQEQHPDINFVGLLIGPRGNTLKSLERDSGAKIIIRGKGSVKEGKVCRKDGQPMAGEDEPLHAFITAPTMEQVKLAVFKINEIVRKGIELPENKNDLRRTQLRELAQLNGTLRDIDSMRCSNCGSGAHKGWQCPEKQNITNTLTCFNCGGVGHLSRDCKEPRRPPGSAPPLLLLPPPPPPPEDDVEGLLHPPPPPPPLPQQSSEDPYYHGGGEQRQEANLDEEYLSFMAELNQQQIGQPPSATLGSLMRR